MLVLLARRRFRVRQLADELEVNERTIRSDIKWAKEADLPIRNEKVGVEVFYSLDESPFRSLALTRSERESIATLSKTAGVFEGAEVVRRLAALVGPAESPPSHLHIGFPTSRTRTIVTKLDLAIRTHKYVRLNYATRGKDATWRELAPVALYSPTPRLLYLRAWDPNAEQYKTYHLERAYDVELRERTVVGLPPCPMPDDATVTVYHDDPVEVAIRFDANVAGVVPEYQLTKNQRLLDLEDGTVVLRATVRSLLETQSFVLAWGASCEVLEPPDFRARVQSELEHALDKYLPRHESEQDRIEIRSDVSARVVETVLEDGTPPRRP